MSSTAPTPTPAPAEREDAHPRVVDRGALIETAPAEDVERVVERLGDGVDAVALPDGRIEVRASRDGRPVLRDSRIHVDPITVHEGDVTGDLDVVGALRVVGNVRAGARLRATRGIRIEGAVERAGIEAGGTLTVEERAFGSDLRGGIADAIHAGLRGRLHGVADELDDAALGIVPPARRAELAGRLEMAERDLRAAREDWPELMASIAEAIALSRRALVGAVSSVHPAGELATAAAVLRVGIEEDRGRRGAAMRLRRADGCDLRAYGALVISGAGARECRLDVDGDLSAMASGAELLSCDIDVAGRVRVRELSARNRRPTRLRLTSVATQGEALRADAVQAGVEIVTAGRVTAFSRREADVVVTSEAGVPLVMADVARETAAARETGAAVWGRR